MSCSCAEIAAKPKSSSCKCDEFNERHPNCACEGCSVAPSLSPGPVRDDEVLYRVIRFMDWCDPSSGKLCPAAMSDVKGRGLSVKRHKLASAEELAAAVQKHTTPASDGRVQFVPLIAVADAASIRALRAEDGSRLFCMYDTATEDERSHADVCQAYFTPPKSPQRKSHDKKIRKRLLDAFSRVETLEAVLRSKAAEAQSA